MGLDFKQIKLDDLKGHYTQVEKNSDEMFHFCFNILESKNLYLRTRPAVWCIILGKFNFLNFDGFISEM